jgi:hypothetical protein
MVGHVALGATMRGNMAVLNSRVNHECDSASEDKPMARGRALAFRAILPSHVVPAGDTLGI